MLRMCHAAHIKGLFQFSVYLPRVEDKMVYVEGGRVPGKTLIGRLRFITTRIYPLHSRFCGKGLLMRSEGSEECS